MKSSLGEVNKPTASTARALVVNYTTPEKENCSARIEIYVRDSLTSESQSLEKAVIDALGRWEEISSVKVSSVKRVPPTHKA